MEAKYSHFATVYFIFTAEKMWRDSLLLIPKRRDKLALRLPLLNTHPTGDQHPARTPLRKLRWTLGLTTSSWFPYRLPSICMLLTPCEANWFFSFIYLWVARAGQMLKLQHEKLATFNFASFLKSNDPRLLSSFRYSLLSMYNDRSLILCVSLHILWASVIQKWSKTFAISKCDMHWITGDFAFGS